MNVDVSQEQTQVTEFRKEFEVSLQLVAEITAAIKTLKQNCEQRIGVLEKIVAACEKGQALCDYKSELLRQELQVGAGAGEGQMARYAQAVAEHKNVFERLDALRIAYIDCGLFAQQLFRLFVWWRKVNFHKIAHEPSHLRGLAVTWGGLDKETVEKLMGPQNPLEG